MYRRARSSVAVLAGNDFTLLFQQDLQNLERLFLKFDLHSQLAQFTRPEIQLERPKANDLF